MCASFPCFTDLCIVDRSHGSPTPELRQLPRISVIATVWLGTQSFTLPLLGNEFYCLCNAMCTNEAMQLKDVSYVVIELCIYDCCPCLSSHFAIFISIDS
jgi:hypothetical protein